LHKCQRLYRHINIDRNIISARRAFKEHIFIHRCKYRHGARSCTATKCLLNFRHKSLLSFPETCATVISFCVPTRGMRGARKVSCVPTDGRSRGGKEREWQSPLTIARSTEVRVHADRERRERGGQGEETRTTRVLRVLVKSWQSYWLRISLHYARRQFDQSIPPDLTPPSFCLPLWLHSSNNCQ